MAQTYEQYEVRGPFPSCNERIGDDYDTLAEAQDAAQADAQADADDDAERGIETNAWTGRVYEIRGYDGRIWRRVEDFQPRPVLEDGADHLTESENGPRTPILDCLDAYFQHLVSLDNTVVRLRKLGCPASIIAGLEALGEERVV